MPKYIYPSEKVLPYVYMGVHKITGQFYIGSRTGVKSYINRGKPSHIDLLIYQTSSRKIKEMGFDNFDWFIIAEFFSKTAVDDAYWFEQDLIKENWKNSLMINGLFQDRASGAKKFNNAGKTKENDVGTATAAEKHRGKNGKTKETHLGTAIQAKKLKGRTKENDQGRATASRKMTSRTKENDLGVAKISEKRTILNSEQRRKLVQLRNSGIKFKDLHLYFVNILGINISLNAIFATYHRELKINN